MIRLAFLLPALLAFLGAVTPAAAQVDYRLAVGDIVEFDILNDDDAPRKFVIDNNGEVQLPFVGGVRIADLRISEAHDAITDSYVGNEILVDPMISLSIAEYRPVFVLGDVKTPGSYGFQPLMTVEQVIGLAGGVSTLLNNEEERILSRATMRGQLQSIEADIARQAVWIARVRAQLAGRNSIAEDDLPTIAGIELDPEFVGQLKVTEEKIISVEASAFAQDTGALKASVKAATNEVELIEKLVENQEKTIAFYEEEVDRSKQLQDRGLTARAEVGRRGQELMNAQSGLLQIYGEISRARRNQGELERSLAQKIAERTQTLLQDQQERQLMLEKLTKEYRSVEGQLSLLTSWSEAESVRASTAKVFMSIRRNTGGTSTVIKAGPTTGLAPGDTLTVTVERERQIALDLEP
ncbi:polysaccharide export protein [Acuticoccus sp. M5D2P5]|uniref:polysaccharide biosynthesis/export family protein n=1 Tax=Acuticoccus kalidii TaxID=2910977 RepID=UPI001F45FBF5|nr:polysaccharide biosynthesis/export family protein [Acuticoccus kalidii]MCF3935160.1 polysaccharide export protein [Acuticoccus kalidii]